MTCYKENSDKKYALIFSCPGSKELKENKPCSGKTGRNLEELLSIVHNMSPNRNFSEKREDYIINNSWPIVEYKKATKRTEATTNEICKDWNILRLKEELKGVEKVIAFGKNAGTVIDKLKSTYYNNLTVIKVKHISMTSINTQISVDINNKQIIKKEKNATKRRLEVIAKEIHNNL